MIGFIKAMASEYGLGWTAATIAVTVSFFIMSVLATIGVFVGG